MQNIMMADTSKLTLCAPCLFGLESVLAHEIGRIGGENIRAQDGRVLFDGDKAVAARANLCLRTAERVCIVIGSFGAESFTELFDRTAEIALEEFIRIDDAFPVTGWSLKSKLASVPDCQSIIKKAMVKRLEKEYQRSWFNETGSLHQVRFSIFKDEVTIMLDMSGTGLHKRGYRQNSIIAPIKETLAAGIADLARISGDDIVVDPMCGSGTLLIESALRAYNIPPGIRRKFSAESWSFFPAEIWEVARKESLDNIRKKVTFSAFGYDNDQAAVDLTGSNATKAGVGRKISANLQDLSKLLLNQDRAAVICNPPYGERLLELKQAEELYKQMGKVFPKRDGLRYYIISPHEEFEAIFGRKADKRRKLYNGMIKCQLFMYFK